MTTLRPADDTRPAAWLLSAGVDWWDLVRFGPPGFDVYLRLPLDPVGPDELELGACRTALATLAEHTTTPGSAYAALWEGHGLGPDPSAPLVRVPSRAMFLFAGPVSTTYAAHAVAWGLDDEGQGPDPDWPEPDLVWPEDHAWCLACDVDEEVELTVGCSYAAATAIEAALPGHARRVAYAADVPLLRTDD